MTSARSSALDFLHNDRRVAAPLTEIGQTVLQHCQRIAAEVAEASAIVSEMQSQLRGTVRICVPFGLASTWISRALARFALEYPDLKITLHVTNSWVDVSEDPFDVAICIGRLRNENLPARRLAVSTTARRTASAEAFPQARRNCSITTASLWKASCRTSYGPSTSPAPTIQPAWSRA